jgi:GNAT superfamily N-acetyltransferase
MSEYRIRPAAETDAEEIALLVDTAADLEQMSPRESFPLTAAIVVQWLRERASGYILLENEALVAYAELNADDEVRQRYWIGHLAVHPRKRGRGRGRVFVHGLGRVARTLQRAREVWISAFAENAAALRCYESAGFQRVGARRVLGRQLIDLRLRVDDDRHIFSRRALAIYGAMAGLLSLALLPGQTRAMLGSHLNLTLTILTLVIAPALSAAAAVAFRPVLPHRDTGGVALLLRPLFHSILAGVVTALGWLALSFIFTNSSELSLPGTLRLAPQYGAGWGIITTFLAQMLLRR